MNKNVNVLVINDNIQLLKRLERFLLDDGYAVVTTEFARIGIKLHKKKKFDLILIDFHLDKDDHKTAEFYIPKLKAINSSIPIILMSATEENLSTSDFNVTDFLYLDNDFWDELSNHLKKYTNN